MKKYHIEIQKQKFHQHKGPISIWNIDNNKIVVSNKVSFGKKKDLDISLAIKMLKKLCLYVYFSQKWVHIKRYFDETKYISFFMKDDKLLEKYNKIWEKVKISPKKEFDSEPVYNEKHLKAKIKSYNGKINTNFHNNKIPKEGSQCICLSVTLIDSVWRTGSNYYPQIGC